MAPKYSPDTEAIIERLKIEGDLIRNSDNNSMRSVNLKLDRFENVFKSINEGIILQSSAMQSSVKMAQDQAESVKRKEDFDDLKRDETTKKETKSKDKRDKSLIKGIASAMSMKNMRNALLGAGGLAAGGLIAKGFIGEKYPEFSEDLAETFSGLKTTFSDMQASISLFNENLSNLSQNMQTLADGVPWGAIAIGLAGLALLPSRAGRFGFGLAAGAVKGGAQLFRGGRRTGGGLAEAKAIKEAQELAAREAAEVAARRASGEAGQELAEALAKRSAAITQLVIEQDRLVMEAMGVRPDTILPNGNKTVAGMFTSPGAPNIKVTDIGNGNFRYQNMDAPGRPFMKNATAVSRLSAAGLGPDGLPSVGSAAPRPQVGRGNGRLQMNALRNDRAAGQAMKDAGVRLAGKYVKTEAGKVAAKAIPLAGAVIGLGFAAYSWLIGDTTTRNIELASVVLPSVLGGIALDLVAATTSIFFHVTRDMSPNGVGQTYNQANPAHPPLWWAIMTMVVEEVEKNIERASHNPHAHRGGTELEMRAAEMAAAELAAGGGMPPTGMGANPDIGNMSLGSYNGAPDNRLNQSAAFGGNYYTGPGGVLMFQPRNGPAIRASERPNRAATVEGSGSGSTVVISAPTTVAPNVNYTHGGNTESNLNVLNVGGGSGGGGNGSLSPFVQ